MKKYFMCLVLGFMLLVGISAQAASNVSLAWDAGSADVTKYAVYQSTISGTYNKTTGKVCETAANTRTCTISAIPDGTYYWVATAFDAAGNESGYSNEVRVVLDSTAPAPPPNLRSTTVTVTVVVQ